MKTLISIALIAFSSVGKANDIPNECVFSGVINTEKDLKQMIENGCKRIATASNALVNFQSESTTYVPSDVTLQFDNDSKWHLNENASVEIDGSYEIPLVRQQFFTGAGSVTTLKTRLAEQASCSTNLTIAYPEWFGAKTMEREQLDAPTLDTAYLQNDDSIAISKALMLGDHVQLEQGNYHLKNRLLLDRNQSLTGEGMSVSRLNQLSNANIVQFQTSDWYDYLLQDFIVGLASDCATIKNLSILGNALPDDLSGHSDVREHLGIDPLVSGIQISSHIGWRSPTPAIKNILVKGVEVYYPASNCVNIQSDRGARDVLIDGFVCHARNSRPNTSGLTIEAFHPKPEHANRYENIQVKNAEFNGGSWGLYIAGVTGFTLEDSAINADPGAYSAALFYTSDNGHPITAMVNNTSFSLMEPSTDSRAVIELAGRNYAKDVIGDFPYLLETESSITFDNISVDSAEHPSDRLVPLVLDNIGFKYPVEFKQSTFTGGRNAIFAGNPYPYANPEKPEETTDFGATVYIAQVGAPTVIRDLLEQEIPEYNVHHSKFYISQSQFYRQAGTSIKLNYGALSLFDSTFYDIGLSSYYLDEPIIDLGRPTLFGIWSPHYHVQNNAYSGIHATAFLRLPSDVLTNQTTWSANAAFATPQSRPVTTMDSIRVY